MPKNYREEMFKKKLPDALSSAFPLVSKALSMQIGTRMMEIYHTESIPTLLLVPVQASLEQGIG